ncbi:MAG: hypothetical protein JOY54_08915 [Acidobacteriaceae bacterium]|nr:hypothetical protein [Acidobacteriaceae bacterium]
MRDSKLLVCACALLFLSVSAFGKVATVGGAGSRSGFPFGNSSYSGQYEAEYTLPDLGSIDIQSLSFAIANGTGGTGTFTIGLASGANPVGKMNSSYQANIGSGYKTVFSGSLAVPSTGSLTIPLSGGFHFTADSADPLLLFVDVTGPHAGSTEFVAGADTSTEQIANLYGYRAPFSDDITLQMQIAYSSSETPEPSYFLLVSCGFLALALAKRFSSSLRRPDGRSTGPDRAGRA